MNRTEITKVLCDLHKITGFRISLHSPDFREIAAYPERATPFCEYVHSVKGELEKCCLCDREGASVAQRTGKSHMYRCRWGLLEVASPLYSFGMLSGFLMMGQVRLLSDDHAAECDRLCRTLIPEEQMRRRMLASIGTVSPDILRSYVNIMTVCAEYLTLSGSVPSETPGIAHLAKKYIADRFREKIVLSQMCADLACSKSTLMSAFRRAFGTTVGEYLTSVRLTEASHLLCNRDLSVSEIAAACGFSDQSYFSKVFSARFGMSPTEYRHTLPQEPSPFIADTSDL